MTNIIQEIKQDDYSNFFKLLEMFNPLIKNWLYKIRANANDREDFYSSAKIILLESVKSFDESKGVPFPSYYKIKLYNWFGNKISKGKNKTADCELGDNDKIEEINFIKNLETSEKISEIEKNSKCLTKQEKDILKDLLNNVAEKEIAYKMGLSKKTILNKKYIIISKIKKEIKTTL